MTIAECLRSISFNEIEEILSQYGSQIRFIFHTCLYLEGEIILFLILTIWEHDASLILWIIEFILILHLFDFLLDGTNLLQLRKLKMFTIELQYLVQLSQRSKPLIETHPCQTRNH